MLCLDADDMIPNIYLALSSVRLSTASIPNLILHDPFHLFLLVITELSSWNHSIFENILSKIGHIEHQNGMYPEKKDSKEEGSPKLEHKSTKLHEHRHPVMNERVRALWKGLEDWKEISRMDGEPHGDRSIQNETTHHEKGGQNDIRTTIPYMHLISKDIVQSVEVLEVAIEILNGIRATQNRIMKKKDEEDPIVQHVECSLDYYLITFKGVLSRIKTLEKRLDNQINMVDYK
jgi:hypothetical protein